MKKIIAIALAAVMCISMLAACSSSSSATTTAAAAASGDASAEASGEIAGLTDQGVLRVGMECAYAPFNWTQADETDTTYAISGGSGYADGYDVQIAKKIADELGLTLEIYAIEWDGLIPALTSGTIDVIIAGMSPTDERKETIDFSEYYWESSMCLVVKKDSEYANATSLEDLAGAVLCAQADTSHYAVLSQAEEAGATINPAMEGFTELTTALVAGTIDGYTCETPSAQAAAYANPDLTYIEDVGFEFDPVDVSVSIAVRKDSGLDATINGIISELSKDDRTELMQAAVERQPLSEE